MFKLTTIPLALTALRALLAPVVVVLALFYPSSAGFGICLILAFVSDIFDGIIARRLGIATPTLRRLDSIADSVFYIAAVVAVWHLYPQVILQYIGLLLLLATLEAVRYAFDLVKFKKEASYHMWSSKLWGICLFAGFFDLLALDNNGLAIFLAIAVGIVADIEGLAISIVMKHWQTDVPTIFHAWRARSTQ